MTRSVPFDYRDKRVIVTGCFSGIGHATAHLLHQAGAEVHGFDCRMPDLSLASFTTTDLRERASIDAAIDGLGGDFHALFSCAGLPPGRPALDVMTVNFIGMRHFSERVMARLSPGGAIVTVGSNGGAGWCKHLPELTELAGTEGLDEAYASIAPARARCRRRCWMRSQRLPLNRPLMR